MENASNTPSLRFRGYTDAWGQERLGDVADIVGGGTPSTGNSSYWDGDINWFAPAELAGQRFASKSQRQITKAGLDNSSAKMLPVGTVLFTSRAGIGTTAILTEPACTNQGFQSIIPHKDELDSYFVYSMTPQLKEYGETTGAGSTFVEVSGKQMSNMPIMLPKDFREQQEIGRFFCGLDSLLSLHQRKLEKLQAIKKSLLQKMFPAEGEDRPQIRFAGYTDAWGQERLGDIAQITMGQSPDGANYTDNPKDHILVQGNADMKDHRVCPRVWTTQVTKTAEPGDIILSVRAPVGEVGKTDYDVVLGRGVSGIRGNDFIYHSLIRMNEIGYWSSLSTGSTFDSINSNDISNAVIAVPSQSEQEKIGCFLTRIDDLLSLHQRKLEKLQKIKKALLEQMFC